MRFFNNGKAITLLNGVTGKLGVTFFCVCLGYFAYLSKEKNPGKYILRRFFYFFFCGFLINLVLSFYEILKGNEGFDFFYILVTSLRLGNDIFPLYWCVIPFFLASVLGYIDGKANVSSIGILFQIVFLYMAGQEWTAICLLGALTAVIVNRKDQIFTNRILKTAILIGIFFAIKRPECKETFFIDGLCSAALLLVVENSSSLQKILNFRYLTGMGKNSMAIFLSHQLIYTILGNFLMKMYFIPYGIRFLVVMMICLIVIVGLSYLITYFINKVMDAFSQCLAKYAEGM